MDIEANFNSGLLHLQFGQDLALALDGFKKSVALDMISVGDSGALAPGVQSKRAMYRA